MDSFPRLWPFVAPHRFKLIISTVIGILIAGLWGANLTVAYPVITILLDDKSPVLDAQGEVVAAAEGTNSLRLYVDRWFEDSSTKLENLKLGLASISTQLDELQQQATPATDPNYVKLLQRQSRLQADVASTSQDLSQASWVRAYVIPYVPQDEFQTLCWLLVAVLVATLIKGVLIYWQDMLVGSVAESTVRDLRQNLLAKTLDLDFQTLSLEGKSGLMSRFTYDSEQLSIGISMLGGKMIREPLKCLACMALALAFNWRLTLLSLVFIPLLGLFLSRFGKMLKRASRKMMESMSQIYKILEETFDGLKVVIGFHNAEHHKQLFSSQYSTFYSKSMKVVKIDAASKPLLELLGLAAMFAALIPGAYLVLRGKTDLLGVQLAGRVMDGAQLGLIYVLLAGMLDPCRKMSGGFTRLKRCTAAIDRIFQLMDRHSLIVERPAPAPLTRHATSLTFEDISFRYATRDPQASRGLALEHVDLEIAHGEVVAIVGQNGCGKSTLVNLLPRFYDPEAGDVKIDGRSIRDVALADLRSQVGVVTQETLLFDGTILDNIRYGSPQATLSQVEEAARQAHVLPIIRSMPQGFDTVIGDRGKDLSGGQRQRIALARVMLRDPSILILDEATSAADAESESLIHQALQAFVKGRTTLLISHTLSHSLLSFITRIVVMENGKIVASGTHEELLRMCPLYHRLYNAPSRQMHSVRAA